MTTAKGKAGTAPAPDGTNETAPHPPRAATSHIARKLLAVQVFAAFLLAMSVTMLTDFIHRLLSADTDAIGIASIAFQAVVAIAATSSFTAFGWSLLPNFLSRLQKTGAGKAGLSLGLSAGFFVAVTLIWLFARPGLADFYNTRGYNLPKNSDAAARDYRRAIALDPTQQAAYYNLGETLETEYRYSDAAEQYQKAIAARPTDANPYSNLAHVLLLDGKSLTALQISDDALALPNLMPITIAALRKNRAQAELDLGFFRAAIADANLANEAYVLAKPTQPGLLAAQCVLGKSYAKLSQKADAQQAWTTFTRIRQEPQSSAQTAEPDCLRIAEEQHENP